jgi:hypothetical protein
MENDAHFVERMLASLEPRWHPDTLRARRRFEVVSKSGPLAEESGSDQRSRGAWRWLATAATAGLCVVAAALAVPETRAMAQGLWDRWVFDRVDAVRIDLSKLPLRMHVTMSAVEEPVADVDEAGRQAGFRPGLPPWAVVGSVPELTVSGPASVEQTIDVHELESALRNAGLTGTKVPEEWDGVTLRAEIGRMVTAKYPDGVEITQIRPIELRVPAGFPLERFAEVAFLSIGVPWREARSMARDFAAHPSWLFDIPPGKGANVEELTLRSGPVLMIEDLNEAGAVESANAIRSTFDRTYAVRSRTRAVTVKIVESLP